jgi:prepilin peptidase CpaA
VPPIHLAPAFFAAALVLGFVAAVVDLRRGEIPNAVTLVPLALAPVLHAGAAALAGRTHEAHIAAALSVLGAVAAGAVPYVLWRADAIGGGDVKLLAAIGALLRPMIGVEAVFYAFVAAAVLALAQMAWQGKLLVVLGNALALALNPLRKKESRREVAPEMMTWARMGPAIALGTAAAIAVQWRAA